MSKTFFSCVKYFKLMNCNQKVSVGYIENRRPPTGERRPTSHFENFQTASATVHPIHYFVIGSRIAFSRSADRAALFPVGSNPRWRLAGILLTS